MNDKLIVSEKYSRHWPVIAGISLLLAALLFLWYGLASNVLFEGYLRLAAFAFFALGLLSLFKIKDGQVVLELTYDAEENVLSSAYKVRGRTICEENWSGSEIREIRIDQMPNRSLYNDIMKGDRCLRFRRPDTEDWLYFNKINGRVIPFSRENAEKVYEFLSRTTGT